MDRYIEFLDGVISRLQAEGMSLAASDRNDEAALVKVRANVYGICRTIVTVLDAEGYRKKLDNLRDTWSRALEMANAHGDVKQAVIEEIKLEALAEAAAQFGR